MKKTALKSAAVCFCILLGAVACFACGDKLLYLNRIYLHHEATHSTIAVYSHPNSLLQNAESLNLAKAFHEGGYNLLLVNSNRDLTLALQSGAADLIIADIADVPSIQRNASAARIPIIPVIGKEGFSKTEARQFVATIKAPVKTDKFLDALDRAFDSREMRQNANRAKVTHVSLK